MAELITAQGKPAPLLTRDQTSPARIGDGYVYRIVLESGEVVHVADSRDHDAIDNELMTVMPGARVKFAGVVNRKGNLIGRGSTRADRIAHIQYADAVAEIDELLEDDEADDGDDDGDPVATTAPMAARPTFPKTRR